MDVVKNVATEVWKYRPQYLVVGDVVLPAKTVLEFKIIAFAAVTLWGIYSNKHEIDPYNYVNYFQKFCQLGNLKLKKF